ncbi:hypothetical protein LH464_23710 [Neorhizobium sp. T786]|uniref:hypothetical protein n=1 Tax=Pseudorhizobium xiangyangii TaxID=2883104 RepID=UPI001CFF6048|nr:hypothetical protein [Neorhizobium xiangyangii]MCB5205459.1 hypothetical protein [Neorhizobium xiangyangii]
MNSVLEMAVALQQYNAGKINAAHTAPIITANLSGLDQLDTLSLWKLAQSVGFSLADSEGIGDDAEVREKSERLQRQLNQMISERTSVIEITAHLADEFRPEQLLHTSFNDSEAYEIRKAPSSEVVFLCGKDAKNQLSGFRKFRCLKDLEEAAWE